MNTILLLHSIVRYLLLIFLILVIAKSLMGWMQKKKFEAIDNKLSLWLFILTHTQLLIGIILFFISPIVIFSGSSMKDSVARYWLVEHNTMMLVAIVLISVARISSKKLTDGVSKHKRLFIFNALALVIILAAISMSGRGMFSLPV
jgi:hypothetical protein